MLHVRERNLLIESETFHKKMHIHCFYFHRFPFVSASSATITWNVGHKIVYAVAGPVCYDHGGTIHDSLDLTNTMEYWCDWQDSGAGACNGNYKNIGHYGQGLYEMLNALWSDQ
jgi:hypothetical protein